jgi:hypothetical protein
MRGLRSRLGLRSRFFMRGFIINFQEKIKTRGAVGKHGPFLYFKFFAPLM